SGFAGRDGTDAWPPLYGWARAVGRGVAKDRPRSGMCEVRRPTLDSRRAYGGARRPRRVRDLSTLRPIVERPHDNPRFDRFSTVRMADLIVVMEGGKVAEQGSHLEFVQRGGTYAELF